MAVSWKLPIALNTLIACSLYLDISISYTQHHLWKLPPTDLVTVETCNQSSDKLVWIILQRSKICLSTAWSTLRQTLSLQAPPQVLHQGAKQHCPVPNSTVQHIRKVTSDLERAWDKHQPSMVASPLLVLEKEECYPGFLLLIIALSLIKMQFPHVFQQRLILY